MGSKRHQVAAKGRAAASPPKSARDSTLAPTPIAVPHSTFREHGSVTHPGYALSFYSSFIFMCIGWTQATMVCLCMTGCTISTLTIGVNVLVSTAALQVEVALPAVLIHTKTTRQVVLI